MSGRFAGTDGHRRLIDALGDQNLLRGEQSLPAMFADCVEVVDLAADDVMFVQGEDDFDMVFLLSGRVDIMVNGRLVASRWPGQHVGEMALIDPSARRSATVVAAEDCVVARISESDFTRVATVHPNLWRQLARELAERLRQRNDLVVHRRSVPHMFVGSSAEHYEVAQAVSTELRSPTLDVRTWKEDVFRPSSYTLVDLENEAHASDFAVLILGEDDLVESRGELHVAPRDNVILELGLFVGACGRERVFLLVPDGDTVKLPSDLTGITTLRFTPSGPPAKLHVANAVAAIAKVVELMGAL